MIRTDLGIATAYAEAVSKGYTGTRDEFGQMFVDFGKTAEKVTEDKKSVEQMKASVQETKNSVDTTAAEFGQNVADKTEEAKADITEHANTEKASATAAISEAKDDATGAITEAQTSATDAIAAVKDSATSEIAKKGTDTLATIPEDYTALSKDVSSLKEDLSNKITKFYASNQGETHITDSDNGKIVDMMIYGKSSQDGTPSLENPVEIKSVVNPTVKVSNEDGTKSQTVTLPYTLNAIPVSSDGNVTIGGQQYIADYVDIEKGKLYRKVKRLNLKDVDDAGITYGLHSNGNGYLSISSEPNASKEQRPISNQYKSSEWTNASGYLYIPSSDSIVLVDDRFTDRQTAIKLVQDTYVIYALSSQTEEDLSLEQIKSLKSLSTNYPVTNCDVDSEELDGYAVFNYPVSMANGWNYVKQQLNDNRDYIYDMDLQAAEAYVNSEYAVALTELEV